MRYLRLVLITACFAALVASRGAPASAATFTRLQVLLPGESPAPGSGSGKTGSPSAQVAGVPFTVTVRACDSNWNLVTSATDAIGILSSDASATLPPSAQLAGGTRTFSLTLNAAGSFVVYAHDLTDATIPDGTSSQVASAVLQGFTFSSISRKNHDAGEPISVTLTAVDPNGQTVSGYNGQVLLKEITSYGDGRISPDRITLSSGTWHGDVTPYRADETNPNRGNANIYAWLESTPTKSGTSDPFQLHPGSFARLQVVVPGQTPLPGSVSGVTGTPAAQAAGRSFTVSVYGTDDYWNPVHAYDSVRLTSNDPGYIPQTGSLSDGYRSFTVALATVGTRTITASDQSNSRISSHTSAAITVTSNAAERFVIGTIPSPVTAGSPVTVTIRATDLNGNTVAGYDGDAILTANTGARSITPDLITFANGTWTGPVTFRGAGGAVMLTCSDFSSPPHTGTSGQFTVVAGALAALQILVPGETAEGGTLDGKSGVPLGQSAGVPFTLTLRAVDAWWNLVPTATVRVALGSTDEFAVPAETTIVGGQLLMTLRLYRSGSQRVWASAVNPTYPASDTSSVVNVTGGTFSRVLILAPGEYAAPGTATGHGGTATDQSINYAFTVTVLATDQWWNPVGGVSDRVHLTSSDPMAQLEADKAMVGGRADMTARLAAGGYQQISVTDLTNPGKTGGSTQVRMITSGFHLEASVSPAAARAGEPFTLSVSVTNDAGSVIQEVNSFVTIEAQNASTRQAGRGTLLATEFQLLQGQRSVTESYTFAEPMVFVVHDDAGNAPAITGVIDITPGAPALIHLTTDPAWAHGNKHVAVSARLVDAFENGVPNEALQFAIDSGGGSLSGGDSLTDVAGAAGADFLSPREPQTTRIRASWQGLTSYYDVVTALVDPLAPGGTIASYPNPFHPDLAPAVIAYKLDDAAGVTLRVFTQSGGLVRRVTFASGSAGGVQGVNEWRWDGTNDAGDKVGSGGYIVLVEARGTGETLHVMRRLVAVIR